MNIDNYCIACHIHTTFRIIRTTYKSKTLPPLPQEPNSILVRVIIILILLLILSFINPFESITFDSRLFYITAPSILITSALAVYKQIVFIRALEDRHRQRFEKAEIQDEPNYIITECIQCNRKVTLLLDRTNRVRVPLRFVPT